MSTIDILYKYREEFSLGILVTLKMCLLIWPIGLLAGSVLAVGGWKWPRVVGLPTRITAFLLSGIPILVFLFWLHYPLQTLLRIIVEPFWTAVAALSIVNTFLVAEAVRSSLADFPKQYLTAAKVCGLSARQTVLGIQFPIIFRQVLPGLLLIQVSMLQATLFASLISVDEIFRISQRVNSLVYRPVEIYTALAVLFLVVCLPMHAIAHWLRSRFSRDFSEN
jgi:polar amino acid transport system permease protein